MQVNTALYEVEVTTFTVPTLVITRPSFYPDI